MRVLLLREATRAAETAAALGIHGFTPLLLPLETVELLSPSPPEGRFDMLVATSAHALPWLVHHCPPDGRPLFAVGPATAAAARQAGYGNVTAAGGNAASLKALLVQRARGQRILYAAGLPRRPELEHGLADAGLAFDTVTVYRAGSREPLSGEVEALIGKTPPDCVVLLSAGQAEAYGRLLARFGGSVAVKAIYCLSPRIAAALPPHLAPLCVVSRVPAMDSLVDAMLQHRCTPP